MSPHALEYDMFALEIQSQLRTDPGTAYGALLITVIFPIARLQVATAKLTTSHD